MKRLLAAGCCALLASGCGTALGPAPVATSFSEVFAGLYAGQQRQLGRTDLFADQLQVLSSCRRTGPQGSGPGDDWSCTVQYADAGTSAAQSFEVQVKPDGCWKADGAPAAQPPELVDAETGRRFVNPLAEFDGCLDTSW